MTLGGASFILSHAVGIAAEVPATFAMPFLTLGRAPERPVLTSPDPSSRAAAAPVR
jgi:hypothetical protein